MQGTFTSDEVMAAVTELPSIGMLQLEVVLWRRRAQRLQAALADLQQESPVMDPIEG